MPLPNLLIQQQRSSICQPSHHTRASRIHHRRIIKLRIRPTTQLCNPFGPSGGSMNMSYSADVHYSESPLAKGWGFNLHEPVTGLQSMNAVSNGANHERSS